MSVDPSSIRIVPASLEYIESFRDCLDDVARERKWLMTLQAPPLVEVQVYWEKMIADEVTAFFALDGSRVVGFIDIRPDLKDGVRHRARLGMGVLCDYRGCRIGRRLLETALARAKERGLMRVDLTVYASNAAAIGLYRKIGFVEEGRMIKGRYLDGRFDDIIQMGLIFQENLPPEE
jgi:ribosomal protein S18 acetylase RimI-like enzyme